MEPLVGFRFHPTDLELIDHYLHNKILGNDPWLLHRAMNEVDIYKFDPWDLHTQSKIRSKDPVWYFFCPRNNTNQKKGTKRTTSSGYWKATGVDRKIQGKGNSGEIGAKKTLVFYLGRVPNGVRTHYVMHEYQSSVLPPDKKTYVICKVKYKGEDADVTSSAGSELSHSLASNLNNADMDVVSWGNQLVQGTPESIYCSENDTVMPSHGQNGMSLWDIPNLDEFGGSSNMRLKSPYWTQNENELHCSLADITQEDWDSMFADQGQAPYGNRMQENYNDYRPQKALTGVYVDSSSESDAESISAKSYQETSSPVDSPGSSNGHLQNDLDALHVDEKILSLDQKELAATGKPSIRRKVRESQSQSELQGQLTRFQLQGEHHRVLPSKQEARRVAEGPRAAAPSKNERELKMAPETNKKISAAITERMKGCFILQSAVDEGREHPRYVYLAKTIIGIILFVALICKGISAR